MKGGLKLLIILITVLYVVAPDFMPGPIDDIIVILMGLVAQSKLSVVDPE